MKSIFGPLRIFILLVCCHAFWLGARGQKSVPNIIFETDIGNDVDDALALDMIYKYLDRGQINLLAVCSNKQSKYSTEYVYLMNYWYGYPKVPIGKVTGGADSENDAKKYAEYVCQLKDAKGKPLFRRPVFDYEKIPDAVQLYRKILSKQKDASVTIVSVGFSTNISRLLQSGPDQYSALSGKELIAKKVKLLSVMAGSFGKKPIAEYNIIKDIPAARLLANEWPTPVVYSPAEVGEAVLYPATSIENDFTWTKHHPVVEAYKYYMKMPYNRPTWDLTALLYAVEGPSAYFGISPRGRVTVDDKGFTLFTADPHADRAYLTVSPEQSKTILKRFIELITSKPRKQNIYSSQN